MINIYFYRLLHSSGSAISSALPCLAKPKSISHDPGLTSSSHCCQPAVSHHFSTIIFISIRPLPLTSLLFQIGLPKTRCSLLPHHPTFIPAGQRPHPAPNRHSASQIAPPDLGWLFFSPLQSSPISAPLTSSRHR